MKIASIIAKCVEKVDTIQNVITLGNTAGDAIGALAYIKESQRELKRQDDDNGDFEDTDDCGT